MNDAAIHPSALIEQGAEIGSGCEIGAFAVVESGARVGPNCRIESHSIVKGGAVLETGVRVGHFAVVGGDPQYLQFDPLTRSGVVVGARSRLGEGVTVHRSILPVGRTLIGEDCFLMGNSHVAHDCELSDRVVLANGALLGGHVCLHSDVFVGGGAAVHQFVRVGSGAMIGGLAEISLDVAPQLLVSGRNRVSGLNLIGLKRRNVSPEEVAALKQAFRAIMRPGSIVRHAEDFYKGQGRGAGLIVSDFVDFFLRQSRGFARWHGCKRQSEGGFGGNG